MRFHLIFGIIWGIHSIVQLLFFDRSGWFDLFWSAISITYIGTYIYQYNNHYLKLENNILHEQWWYGKSVALEELISMKKFAGDYILKTKDKTLTITTQILEPKSLEELDTILDELEISWT